MGRRRVWMAAAALALVLAAMLAGALFSPGRVVGRALGASWQALGRGGRGWLEAAGALPALERAAGGPALQELYLGLPAGPMGEPGAGLTLHSDLPGGTVELAGSLQLGGAPVASGYLWAGGGQTVLRLPVISSRCYGFENAAFGAQWNGSALGGLAGLTLDDTAGLDLPAALAELAGRDAGQSKALKEALARLLAETEVKKTGKEPLRLGGEALACTGYSLHLEEAALAQGWARVGELARESALGQLARLAAGFVPDGPWPEGWAGLEPAGPLEGRVYLYKGRAVQLALSLPVRRQGVEQRLTVEAEMGPEGETPGVLALRLELEGHTVALDLEAGGHTAGEGQWLHATLAAAWPEGEWSGQLDLELSPREAGPGRLCLQGAAEWTEDGESAAWELAAEGSLESRPKEERLQLALDSLTLTGPGQSQSARLEYRVEPLLSHPFTLPEYQPLLGLGAEELERIWAGANRELMAGLWREAEKLGGDATG